MSTVKVSSVGLTPAQQKSLQSIVDSNPSAAAAYASGYASVAQPSKSSSSSSSSSSKSSSSSSSSSAPAATGYKKENGILYDSSGRVVVDGPTLGKYYNTTPESSGSIPAVAAPAVDKFKDVISSDPFVADLLKDPKMKAEYDNMPDNIKGAFLQSASSLSKAVEAGKVVNPAIEITPAKAKEFLDQATSELDPYYQEQLKHLAGDFQTSIDRLMQDYTTGTARAGETLKQNIADQSQSEAESGTAFSSGRVDRQNRTLTLTSNALADNANNVNRSAQDAATNLERKIGSNAVRSLNIPSLSTYSATEGGLSPASSRSLYTPLGDVAIGEVPGQEKTAIAGRKSELETAYRAGRILDLSTLH